MSRYLYLFILLNFVFGLIAFSSYAGDGKPGGGIHGPSTPISFEELKRRCERPEDFDVQRAPQNIKIQCSDSRRGFIASAPGEVSLPGSRRVTTAIFADKFHVTADQRELPVFSKPGTCHRFKEVEESVTIERPLSCAEILGMKVDLTEFCAMALDATKGANPKLMEVRETGNVIDNCGGGGIQAAPGKVNK